MVLADCAELSLWITIATFAGLFGGIGLFALLTRLYATNNAEEQPGQSEEPTNEAK